MALSLRVGPVDFEKGTRPSAGTLCSVVQASAKNPKLVTVASVRDIIAATILSTDAADKHTADAKMRSNMFAVFGNGKHEVFNASTDRVAAKWATAGADHIRKGWIEIAKLELPPGSLLDSNVPDAAIACSKVYEAIHDLHCYAMAQPVNVFTPSIARSDELSHQRLLQIRQARAGSFPPLDNHAAAYAAYKGADPDIPTDVQASARLTSYLNLTSLRPVGAAPLTVLETEEVGRATAYLAETTRQFGDEVCMNQTRLLRAWTASALAILDNNVAPIEDANKAKKKADILYCRILQGIPLTYNVGGVARLAPQMERYTPTVQKYIGHNHAKNDTMSTPVLLKASEMRRISTRVLSANSIGVTANPIEEHVQTSHIFLLRGVGTSVVPPLPIGASGQSVWISHSLQPLYNTPIKEGSNLDALAASLCTTEALRELTELVMDGATTEDRINAAISTHDAGFRQPLGAGGAPVPGVSGLAISQSRAAARQNMSKAPPNDGLFNATRGYGDAVVAEYDKRCAQLAAEASHAAMSRPTLTSLTSAIRDAAFHAANFTANSDGYTTLTSGAEALTCQVTRNMCTAICTAVGTEEMNLPLPASFVNAIRRYMTVTSWKRHAIGIACSSDIPAPVTAGFWIKALRATNATAITATAAEEANWMIGKSMPPDIGGKLDLTNCNTFIAA